MIRIKELELFHFSKHPKSFWKFNEKLKNFSTQFWMSINCWKPMEPQSRVNILYSQFKFEYRDDEWITTKSTRLGRTKTSMSGLISFVKKSVKYQRIWEVCKQVNMKLTHTWRHHCYWRSRDIDLVKDTCPVFSVKDYWPCFRHFKGLVSQETVVLRRWGGRGNNQIVWFYLLGWWCKLAGKSPRIFRYKFVLSGSVRWLFSDSRKRSSWGNNKLFLWNNSP